MYNNGIHLKYDDQDIIPLYVSHLSCSAWLPASLGMLSFTYHRHIPIRSHRSRVSSLYSINNPHTQNGHTTEDLGIFRADRGLSTPRRMTDTLPLPNA